MSLPRTHQHAARAGDWTTNLTISGWAEGCPICPWGSGIINMHMRAECALPSLGSSCRWATEPLFPTVFTLCGRIKAPNQSYAFSGMRMWSVTQRSYSRFMTICLLLPPSCRQQSIKVSFSPSKSSSNLSSVSIILHTQTNGSPPHCCVPPPLPKGDGFYNHLHFPSSHSSSVCLLTTPCCLTLKAGERRGNLTGSLSRSDSLVSLRGVKSV